MTYKFEINDEVYNRNVEELVLSTRAINCLRRNKITTIKEILDRQHELSDFRHAGMKTVTEIKAAILKMQLDYVLG